MIMLFVPCFGFEAAGLAGTTCSHLRHIRPATTIIPGRCPSPQRSATACHRPPPIMQTHAGDDSSPFLSGPIMPLRVQNLTLVQESDVRRVVGLWEESFDGKRISVKIREVADHVGISARLVRLVLCEHKCEGWSRLLVKAESDRELVSAFLERSGPLTAMASDRNENYRMLSRRIRELVPEEERRRRRAFDVEDGAWAAAVTKAYVTSGHSLQAAAAAAETLSNDSSVSRAATERRVDRLLRRRSLKHLQVQVHDGVRRRKYTDESMIASLRQAAESTHCPSKRGSGYNRLCLRVEPTQ